MQKTNMISFFLISKEIYFIQIKKQEKLCAPLMNSADPNVTPICIPLHTYI